MTRGEAYGIKVSLNTNGFGDVGVYVPRVERPALELPSGDEEDCFVRVWLMGAAHELRSLDEYSAFMDRFRA